jgi:hypothetical protein
MTRYRDIILRVAVRVMPAGILLIIGAWMAKRTTGDPVHDTGVALIGFLFIIAAVAMVAIPLVRQVGDPMSSLFYPTSHSDKPPPMYSIPESKRKNGLFEEAMAAYEKILEQHPDEVRPFLAMMEIAIVDLRDPERGSRIYDRGMSAIAKPEDQEALSQFYLAHCSRVAGQPNWLKQEQAKTLGPRAASKGT